MVDPLKTIIEGKHDPAVIGEEKDGFFFPTNMKTLQRKHKKLP